MSSVSGSCEMFASFEMHCPLCRVVVPANVHHRCVIAAPTTAREKFTLGQRVEQTNWPVRNGTSRTGIVVAFGRRPAIVYVQRDGSKGADSWHMDKWRPIEGGHV